MTIKMQGQFYKIASKQEMPWLKSAFAVFKRQGPFNWVELDWEFDTMEEAQEFIKFEPLLRA